MTVLLIVNYCYERREPGVRYDSNIMYHDGGVGIEGKWTELKLWTSDNFEWSRKVTWCSINVLLHYACQVHTTMDELV